MLAAKAAVALSGSFPASYAGGTAGSSLPVPMHGLLCAREPMATDELFKFDSYLRTFEARVVAVEADGVQLDRTAFYPRGGGQPADTGELRSGHELWSVTGVTRRDGAVVHAVEGLPPELGAVLTGEIDWDRRFNCMRMHTALHALSAVVWQGWGAAVTGSNIGDHGDRGRMDFSLENIRVTDVRDDIATRLNEALAAQRDIRVYDLPRDEALKLPDLIRTHVSLIPPHIERIRIVEIEGLDRQADGGTHVANTREVGPIVIVNAENKGRINRRLEIAFAS